MVAPPTLASEILVQNINRTSTYIYTYCTLLPSPKLFLRRRVRAEGPRPLVPFRTEEDDKVPSLPKVRLPLSLHPTHLLSLTVVHSADAIHYFETMQSQFVAGEN